MTYWHVLSGNLTEMMLPFFDYYDSGIEDFKENAKKLYGCSGIFLPAVTMPGHMKHLCLAPHITNWTAGAGWIAQHYYDYYIYTNDKEFLEKRAVPFMKETAKFYVEFVVWQRDHWHVCPSVSPENHTRNYRRNAKDLGESRSENDLEDGAQTSIDSTMDIAVIKELFYNLLEISNTTNLITPEERKSYEKIIKGAIDYKINEFGAPREWLHEDFPDNDYHRHQSHLFPMFPGLEKTRIDEATNRMFRQGGLRRMTIGLGYQTSWSLIQNGNLMARVCDGELAFQSLNLIAKSCIMRNLFTTHNDWRRNGICLAFPIAPFQIDANIGWPSVIQEMLLFSNKNRLDILPALPRKWYKGKIGELRARCGVETTIEWDEKNYSTRITALRDTNFDLFLPDGSCEKIIMSKGEILLRKNH
jgi:alpha-L-fucosidase 2